MWKCLVVGFLWWTAVATAAARRRRRRTIASAMPSGIPAPYTAVDYGGRHPFEPQRRRRRFLEEVWPDNDDNDYQPIRITPQTNLDDDVSSEMALFVTETILPTLLEFWASALRVFPVQGDLEISSETCRGSGTFENTDLVLFVGMDDQEFCSQLWDDLPTVDYICEKDSFGRPIAGNLQICTDFLVLDDAQSREDAVAAALRSTVHSLGFHSTSFADYYNRTTGLPRTKDDDVVHATVECVEGRNQTLLRRPSEDVMQTVRDKKGVSHFVITTPAVRNVVRNQFNCPNLTGAPLENTPLHAEECFGSNWETRIFPTELMAAASFYDSDYGGWINQLSPLTLAMLEDSGWYIVNYTAAQSSASPFGFGRGCAFVEEPCLVDNAQVPPYSEGYFCNTGIGTRPDVPACTPNRRKLATCTIQEHDKKVPFLQRYFRDHPKMGGIDLMDYCPIYDWTLLELPNAEGQEQLVDFSCEDTSIPQLYASEVVSEVETFGAESRCVESNSNGTRPFCVTTRCNAQDQTVEFVLPTKDTLKCNQGQQVVQTPHGEEITCPPLQEICPHLVCPYLCSGRGTCDFTTMKCDCFDPHDASPSCENSPLEVSQSQPPTTRSSTSDATPRLVGGSLTLLGVVWCGLLWWL